MPQFAGFLAFSGLNAASERRVWYMTAPTLRASRHNFPEGLNVLRTPRSSWFVRRVAIALSLSALLAVQPVASSAYAQTTALTAESVAATVQAFYDQTKSLEAEFHQTYFNRLYEKYDRSQGTVRFQKPGKMRWDYGQPNGKVLVSNGKRMLVYEPGDGTEKGQVFERSMADSELPQALSFLTGTGKLVDDFTFRLLDATKQGFSGGYVLELMPKKASPHYERILFFVDGNAARAGLVHRVLILDGSGNRNRFDFKAMRFNRVTDSTIFEWQPPAGTRRVQP